MYKKNSWHICFTVKLFLPVHAEYVSTQFEMFCLQ